MHELKTLLVPALAVLWLTSGAAAQGNYNLRSPDNRIEVKIRTGDQLQYDVLVNGKALLRNSTASIDIDHVKLGLGLKVKGVKERSVDQMLEPVVRQKFARIRDHYNELRIETEGGLQSSFEPTTKARLTAWKLPCRGPGKDLR